MAPRVYSPRRASPQFARRYRCESHAPRLPRRPGRRCSRGRATRACAPSSSPAPPCRRARAPCSSPSPTRTSSMRPRACTRTTRANATPPPSPRCACSRSSRAWSRIGECGLDFNRNYSPHPDQEKWFAAQVELACELRKPLFLHSRDAKERFIEVLKQYKNLPPAVAHCFTGEQDGAARLSRSRPVHRHHRLDLRRAARRAPARAGARDPAPTG